MLMVFPLTSGLGHHARFNFDLETRIGTRYRVFVALPLVFVSIEPLIWPRPSHAVPKVFYSLLVELGWSTTRLAVQPAEQHAEKRWIE